MDTLEKQAASTADMIRIPGGTFRMGSDRQVHRAIVFFTSLWLATGCVEASAQVQASSLPTPRRRIAWREAARSRSSAVPTAVSLASASSPTITNARNGRCSAANARSAAFA